MEDEMEEKKVKEKKQMQHGILLMAFLPTLNVCLRNETQATQQRMPSTQFDVDFTGIFASLNEFKV